MPITDKTRKILWGRSGNLCALCRRTLVEAATALSGESVVGDECHIIGERAGAARGHLGVGRDDLDECDNLILLCKVHHKLVDDQPETFPVERLHATKSAHESWVKETLASEAGPGQPRFALLPRIRTGKALSNAIANAHAYLLDHDEPNSETEAKAIGGFLQTVRDWGDIWSDLEPSQHVEACVSLAKDIQAIEAAGFLVFGRSERRRMHLADNVFDWPVTVITVVRPTNAGITELGDLACLIAAS